ncbi:MAG: hypothetical protein AB7O52_09385 [Planctomycetota bacterium]
MNVSLIWEKHRRFLLTVAGGLAGFMVLNLFAAGYRDRSGENIQQNRKRASDIAGAIERLDASYDREVKDRKVLEQQLDHYLTQVSTARTSKLAVPKSVSDCQTDFARQRDRIWSAFVDGADKIHLGYPRMTDIPFSLGSDLTQEQWADRYHLLGVVERVLSASVELGVRKIESIQPQAVVAEPIAEAADRALVRYPVKVVLVADFPVIRRLIEYFQSPEHYLTVELDLERKADVNGLTAQILFTGVDVDEPRRDPKKAGTAPRWRP